MTEIIINIDDYLTEEDRRQIARDEFRAACARRSHADFERILSNAAYDLVQKEVDAAFDGNMAEIIRSKSTEIIKGLTGFSVFRAPSAYDKEASKAWQYMQEAIEAARPVLHERMLAIVAEMDHDELRASIDRQIGEVIINKLTGL